MMSLEIFINTYFNDLVRCSSGSRKQLVSTIQDCNMLSDKDKQKLISRIEKFKTIPTYSELLMKAWRF